MPPRVGTQGGIETMRLGFTSRGQSTPAGEPTSSHLFRPERIQATTTLLAPWQWPPAIDMRMLHSCVTLLEESHFGKRRLLLPILERQDESFGERVVEPIEILTTIFLFQLALVGMQQLPSIFPHTVRVW